MGLFFMDISHNLRSFFTNKKYNLNGEEMYLLKRIRKINYQKLFKTVGEMQQLNGKNKILIFLDIIFCGIIYEAGYTDYKVFRMDELSFKERRNIITRGYNNKIVKRFNNPKYNSYFNDKGNFNLVFREYLNRDYVLLNNYSEYITFAQKYHVGIIKPLSLSCGEGIEIIKLKENKEYFNQIKKRPLLEEVVTNHHLINEIYPYSVNTIRIVTLNHHILFAFLRMGNKNNVVDNFNHEGITAKIDLEAGVIVTPGTDKKGNVYLKHPMTNKDIKGFKIPFWNEIKNLAIRLSYIVPEIGYVGWDIGVGEDKLYLIEGNEFPGHDLYELPVFQTNPIGHKNELISLIK